MNRHTLKRLAGAALIVAGCGGDAGSGSPDAVGQDGTSEGDVATSDALTDAGDAGDAGDDDAGPADAGRLEPPTPSLASAVDPRIGTGGHGWYAGSALVGASLPFGLVQASPDTTNDELHWPWDHCSGYHAEDDRLLWISHTHMHGTGIPELGSIGLRPAVGEVDLAQLGDPDVPGPRLDKASESARPGYYAVTLSESELRIELTVTERAAVHRYTPPPGADTLSIVIDAGWTLIPGAVEARTVAIDDTEVRAWAHSINEFSRADRGVDTYLVARFDRAPSATGTAPGPYGPPPDTEPTDQLAWATFDVSDGAPLELRVGVSYVSVDQARANLDAEIAADATFDTVLAAAEARWEAELSILRCDGMSDDQRVVLATSLYHALLMPNLYSDHDGSYVGFDDALHVDPDARRYTNLSLWDTYRTLHPLLTLTHPGVQRDVVVSLIAMADEGGWLPKWPVANSYSNIMIGAPADIVIAESYVKGITDFEVDRALEHMLRMATEVPADDHPYEGRGGIESYLANGWVADDTNDESVSRTLEFCAADFAIGQLAAALGQGELAAEYADRARNYTNQWDAETGYFRPRNGDGTWAAFDPFESGVTGSYTEGNANQYTWMVLHDVPGLVELLGGVEAAAARLDAFMANAAPERARILEGEHDALYWLTSLPTWYWHGNEPDIHAAWLFIELGRPDLAAKWLRWIQDELYGTGVTGLPGNDDSGTLAAWYVFASLGLYPVAGSDRYLLGTPAFPHCELDLPGGTLVIDAPGAELAGSFSDGVELDGVPVEGVSVRHADLVGGAHLQFYLTRE